MVAAASSCLPPLNKTPLRAECASADNNDAGIEMTNAHGDMTTSNVIAR